MPRSAGTTETHDQLSYLASNNWTGRATIKGGNKTSELLKLHIRVQKSTQH